VRLAEDQAKVLINLKPCLPAEPVHISNQLNRRIPSGAQLNERIENCVTVTFAMYDETPIACQGDDDRRKIQVIVEHIGDVGDAHAEALRRSVLLSVEHDMYVQVWDIQHQPAQGDFLKSYKEIDPVQGMFNSSFDPVAQRRRST
jgi:hypothetical protein